MPILGRVGAVTAEMVEEDPERYQPGDVAGLSGLEARYDEQLTGTSGVVVDAIASDGKAREVFRVDAIDGESLATTMDLDLQLEAERLLAGVGPAAALVAVRPSTGAVLAAANGPGTGGVNIATYGQAAPGSTFKTVSTLALLRAGLTPDTLVDCPTSVVVDGRSFENYDDYPPGGIGRIPLRTALANSCNTAFIGEHDRLGPKDLGGGRGHARPGHRPRPRLPGVLRPGADAGVGDRGRRRPDRPGHGARLADGDGHGDGLDPGRHARWCRG